MVILMNIKLSFLLTFIAGFSTLIGFLVIFIKKIDKTSIICSSLAFASGVMSCVSITDLLPESIRMLKTNYNFIFTCFLCFIFLIIGIIISMLIDRFLPSNFDNNRLYKVGIISMLAIILHNIPEGIATFMATNTNINLGLSLTIAIAMHNIPEGISIAIPIYYSTKSKFKAFLYTLISALSEPFGALIAFLFLKNIMTNTILGLLFAIIAGIMLQISITELLPTSLNYKKKKLTIIFFILGTLFMLLRFL